MWSRAGHSGRLLDRRPGSEPGVGVGRALGAAAQLVGCVFAVLLMDLGLRRLARAGTDSWIFFVGVIVVFPIVLIVVRDSTFVYTRHFLLEPYSCSSCWAPWSANGGAAVTGPSPRR